MDQHPGKDLLRDWTSPGSSGGWYWTSRSFAIFSRSVFLGVESVFSGMVVLLGEDFWVKRWRKGNSGRKGVSTRGAGKPESVRLGDSERSLLDNEIGGLYKQ